MSTTAESLSNKNFVSKPRSGHVYSWSLRTKLLMGFGAIIILFLITIGVTLTITSSTKSFTAQVITTELPTYETLSEINYEIYESQMLMQRWLLTHDGLAKEQFKQTWGGIDQLILSVNEMEKNWSNENYSQYWSNIKTNLATLKIMQEKVLADSAVNQATINQSLLEDTAAQLRKTTEMLNVSSLSDSKTLGLLDYQFKELNTDSKTVLNNLTLLQVTELVLATITFFTALIIAFYTARNIISRIQLFRDHSGRITEGDLRHFINVESDDEIGQLGLDLNSMTERLATITKEINQTCHNMVSTLDEVRHAVENQSSGSTEQASSINEITALPYQVSGAKVLEQIAQQMQNKKLPLVSDLRDESDHENPTRLVIVPRSNRVDIDMLMAHLFATTELERSYRVNLNMIGLNGKPQVKNLLIILKEWLDYRVTTVKRRLRYRLDEVDHRLHILAGLLIAYLNLDEVIAIIRKEDQPKPVLMKRFKLSDEQADAILDIKLRHLARLEEMQIKKEQKDLSAEQKELTETLGSNARLKKLIRKELLADVEKLGDKRRSPIKKREAAVAIRETEILPTEQLTVVLSKKGWVRAAKGHDIDPLTLNYKAGDEFLSKAAGRSNQSAIFLDSTGRTYSLPAHTLPSARGQGEPLTGRLNPTANAEFLAVLMGEGPEEFLLTSDAGYGFIAKLEDLYAKNRSGKATLSLPKGSKPLTPRLITNKETDLIAAATNTGHLLICPMTELPNLSKGKGNKILQIPGSRVQTREEFLADIVILPSDQMLVVKAGNKELKLKPADWNHYVSERARRGNKLPRAFQKVQGLLVRKME